MSVDRILLGRVRDGVPVITGSITGKTSPIYVYKHNWDCNWYYGFGYLGNETTHYHFSEYLKGNEWEVANIFNAGTSITQTQWWVICDLFKQAYALKEVASVYRLGGHLCGYAEITYLLRSKEKEASANEDLKLVLDTLWDYLTVVTGE